MEESEDWESIKKDSYKNSNIKEGARISVGKEKAFYHSLLNFREK